MADSIIASMAQENLAEDPLLVPLRRDEEGRPVLGGIPLVCRVLKGGMEAVYYGVHPRLDAEVAVRVLPLSLAKSDAGLSARLADLARLAQDVEDEHVVRILEFDKESGLHFIVMEYIAGDSTGVMLRRLMASGRAALPELDALAYITSATRGLAAAHAAGVLHRDVRPDNILVTRSGSPPAVLAGLGLAKPEGLGHAVGRQVHYAMGTPGFLAPEQAADWRTAAPPADVFAMGATLYTLLVGYPPFTGTTLDATLKATQSKDPDPLPDSIRESVRHVVDKALAKSPSNRYEDGYALLCALAPLAGVDAGPRPEAPAAETEELHLEEVPPPPRAGVPLPPSESIRLDSPSAPEPEPPRVVARREPEPLISAADELERILNETREMPPEEPEPEPVIPPLPVPAPVSADADIDLFFQKLDAIPAPKSEPAPLIPAVVVHPEPEPDPVPVPVPVPVAPPYVAEPFGPGKPPPIQVSWAKRPTRLGVRRRSMFERAWGTVKLLLAMALLAAASYALMWVLTKYV